MTTLREAAQAALEAMDHLHRTGDTQVFDMYGCEATEALRAALVEDAMQKFTDVNQELEAALAEPVQEPVVWMRVIDEAMVVHHCGVADPADDYETAKRKLNSLLCISQDIGEYFAKQAEPVQEPVGFDQLIAETEADHVMRQALADGRRWVAEQFYTTPLQRKPRHVSYVCPQCHWSLDERKPLTDEEIEKAYREIWRDLPSDFDHTSAGWIEMGIKYAERAHGIMP